MSIDESFYTTINLLFNDTRIIKQDVVLCPVEGARIKADLQRERGHSSERPPSAVVEGIAISYRSFPRGPKHTRCCGGEKKKQGNFRKETREIDSGSGFERARDFTTLSESCVEKSRPRGGTPWQTRGWKNWKSGNSPGEIAKSKWASLKLS